MSDSNTVLGLSKDIGQVAVKVAALETGLSALGDKLDISRQEEAKHREYTHEKSRDIIKTQQASAIKRDAQHDEVMKVVEDLSILLRSQATTIEEMEPTIEFVNRWRQRWIGALFTVMGLGSAFTWALIKFAAIKSFFKGLA